VLWLSDNDLIAAPTGATRPRRVSRQVDQSNAMVMGMTSSQRAPVATRRERFSASGWSILFAFLLAAWELYFFVLAETNWLGVWDPHIPLFLPQRLGFNIAWIAVGYLGFQLLSIPFAFRNKDQFVGIFDGLASLVPLAVVGSVLVGATFFNAGYLVAGPGKLEAALVLLVVGGMDLFGGYAINIALSRRQFNVN